MTLTGAVCVGIVSEDPFRVVTECVDDVGLLDVRIEDVTLGALEGDVIELGGDTTDVPLVVRCIVDLGRPRSVGDWRGESGISLGGMRRKSLCFANKKTEMIFNLCRSY